MHQIFRQVGALVYARVVKSHRDINPELSCMDVTGKSAGFGLLKGGYLFECSTGLARTLLSKRTCPVLEALGKSLQKFTIVLPNGKARPPEPLENVAIKLDLETSALH
ncbi:unnamed protein product [Calypogeia fissa]